MMRVAHLIDSLHWGGAEKWIVSFAEVAKLRDLDVTVMSLEPFVENNPYQAQIESFGASVKAFSITRLYDFAALPMFIRTIRAGNYDIIQTHLSHANILGVMIARWVGVPVVATLHSTHLGTHGYYRYRSWVEQFVLRYQVQRIMAVGNGVAEAQRERFRGKTIDIVPNGVKAGAVLSASEREAFRVEIVGQEKRTIIIAIGRLIPLKGYSELLSAFAQARSTHPEAILLVVGDGKLRRDLDEQAMALGLAEDVRFLGQRADVPRLLAAGDIFVNSSHWEGLSIAMLEAMAAGLPILATCVGEAPFLLDEGRGLLVPPHNAAALADGLNSLLDSAATRQRMGAASRAFAESRYSLGPWLDNILEVYAKAQNGMLSRRISLA